MSTITLSRVVAILILAALLVVAGFIIKKVVDASDSFESYASEFIPVCSKEPKIQDYSSRIASYIGTGSLLKEPAYALDIFKEYFACTHQAKTVFTPEEIAKYEPDILNCADAAYLAYAEELKKELAEASADSSAAGKADVVYYNGLIKTLDKESRSFKIYYKLNTGVSPVCNYQATNVQSPVVAS
jgi:hypothetical protein